MPRILLTLSALTTAIVVAAGCGNDGASSSGAASLAPSGSLVYGEATLAPEGGQSAAIDALMAKFPGEGGAGDRIRGLMEKALAASDTDLSYEKDIEPWLGDEAGFFVSDLAPDGRDAATALLVATEDEGASVDAVEKDGDVRKSDYRGHDLYLSVDANEDGAAAVLDGWLVLGNPAGVKAAIDTAEGDEPIEGEEAFERTLEDAPEERLGFLYMNTPGFFEQLQKTGAAGNLGQFRRFFEEPVLATVDADEKGIRFEGTVPAAMLAGFPVVAEGSGAAGDLPADSWLAMAQPDMGETLEAYVDLVAGTLGGRDALRQQIEAATGLDIERDVISWMGDWGLFVRGTSIDELDGALTIETSDEAASGRFLDAVARLARESSDLGPSVGPLDLPGGGEGLTLRGPELPQPLHVFQRDGLVVVAYGDAAAQAAVSPDATLAGSAAFNDAEAALGGDYAVSFYMAIAPVLELAQSAGASGEEFQRALPYLEPRGALVGGARKDGDKLRSAFGLTVR